MAESSVLHVSTFGGLNCAIGGVTIELPTRKAEALLVYLACHPHQHQRETLAALLWDDLPTERAAGNLRLTLNQLRKHVAPFLDITRQTVGIRRDGSVDVDALALEQASTGGDSAALTAALTRYHGDFLQGFFVRQAAAFEEWQVAQVAYWRTLAANGLRTLLGDAQARHDTAHVVQWAQRLLTIEPLDEAAHRAVMLALAQRNQRAQAARQYQSLRALLDAELGLEPEPETQALFEQIRAAPPVPPHVLPQTRTTLLGRDTLLQELVGALARSNRLLTLLGHGGAGKTQLALAAGWQVLRLPFGPFPGGVFFVDIQPAAPPAPRCDAPALLGAVAQVLGLASLRRGPLLPAIVAALAQPCLFIVDNGELLGDDARRTLAALLEQTPASMLVCSRERLRLRHEQTLAVEGLAFPPPRSPLPPDTFPSVALFAERAAPHQPFASYSGSDQQAIVRICQLVEGHPLALELAAAWVPTLAPHDIAIAVAHHLDILHSLDHDLPDRHQSIRAVFAYSWELLPAPARDALARLSVFPARFTRTTADMMGVDADHLRTLIDRSLVYATQEADESWYGLHPLVRSYAAEQLAHMPDLAQQLHARHAAYFAAGLVAAEQHLRGPNAAETLRSATARLPDIQAAWHHACQQQDVVGLGQMSIPLHDICVMQGWGAEGVRLFAAAGRAVDAWAAISTGDATSLPHAARVRSCEAELYYSMGQIEQAEATFLAARLLLSRIADEDSPELQFIYKQLGLIAHWRGRYAQAYQYLSFARAISAEAGDQMRLADVQMALGAVAVAQGEWQIAARHLTDARATYAATTFAWGVSHTERFLAQAHQHQGDIPLALEHGAASVAAALHSGSATTAALAHECEAALLLAAGDLVACEQALETAYRLCRECDFTAGLWRVCATRGLLALRRGQLVPAATHMRQACEFARQLNAPPFVCTALAGLLRVQAASTGPTTEQRRSAAALAQHPACTSETLQLVQPLLEQHPAQSPSWSLAELQERILGVVEDGGYDEARHVHSAVG